MKSGYVPLIGKPNVGKSTLLNRLLKRKLAIISTKPQTTRKRLLGIVTEGDCQCYFLDTPGLLRPDYELQRLMVDQIKAAVRDADVIVYLVDPWFKAEDLQIEFVRSFSQSPILCVINKIDLVPKSQLLPIIAAINDLDVQEVVPVSALHGEGVDELRKTIFTYLPDGPFLFSEEDLSDSPERFFVAELIREKVFELFKKEIPYATCVVIEEFKEREKGKDYIRALIYVERKSQKGILIGKNGEALKKIGVEARTEIEDFLGRQVFLELWVKVREKWRKDRKFLKEIGY